jgi:hypothetical protein
MEEKIIVALDFDGTCVEHKYPKVGEDIGAVPVLKKLVDNGHKLILYTMRSNKTLDDAVKWFSDNGIPLYGIQTNPTQKNWTDSPKCYANLYIDDAALGVPLVCPENERAYIDWLRVEELLRQKGMI